MFLWVVANFIWMTLEFTSSVPSSHVHFGLESPIGGITSHWQLVLVHIKHWLFFMAVVIQIALYVCLYRGIVPMPTDGLSMPDENGSMGTGKTYSGVDHSTNSTDREHDGRGDVVVDLNNIHSHNIDRTQGGKKNDNRMIGLLDSDIDTDEEDEVPENERVFGCSMVVIENFYVLFWMMKDLMWSWSTGYVVEFCIYMYLIAYCN